MSPIDLIIKRPVTVVVGVILILLAGIVALERLPIQLTPNVEDTIISVMTFWEGASPDEIEREIIEEQEEKLQGVTGLRGMTSVSQQSSGSIRLEFEVGTPKEDALREVSDKLREVPEYPANVDEPVIVASDPDNRDYIAWFILSSTDPDFDVRTLQDFAEDRIKPRLERVPGVSEVQVLGGYERETQIRFDPVRLAQLDITPAALVSAIQRSNRNISAGRVSDAKFDVRLRTVSQFESVRDVEETVITYTESGPIYVGDVAEIVETFKEPTSFVRSRAQPVIAINAQREVGSNVMKVMEGLRAAIDRANTPGGLLDTEATRRELAGSLAIEHVYDQTIYIDDALSLVRQNIWLGGGLAVIVLLLFLRSVRSVGIIALAIPISVIGAIVVMVALGRTMNVISLAGMAFAIGLVVDNAIVVLENIFRHLEMGKTPMRAASDGAREVWGAVLAATLTTIAVFVPILLVQEEAGQLFRDIALAICAAVGLSLLVSITVIPTTAGRLLRPRPPRDEEAARPARRRRGVLRTIVLMPWLIVAGLARTIAHLPDRAASFVHWLCGSTLARLGLVAALVAVAIAGSLALMPPTDYLPQGNRNLVFGLLIAPPGQNLQHQQALARRVEADIAPFWEAGAFAPGTAEYEAAAAELPSIPTFSWMTQGPGDPVVPPPVENYFFVGFDGMMFHGAISADADRVVDVQELMQHASRAENAPGVLGFAFQVPLFQLGGATGSAIKIDLSGDDLDEVTTAASGVYGELGRRFGFHTIQPSPSNFDIFGPEIRVIPDQRRLADVGMTPTDLGLAVQACGDGAIIGEYRVAGDSIDLKLIARDAVGREFLGDLTDVPVATATGHVVPLGSLARFERVSSPSEINHVGRQRSVTLLFTPPQGMPLEQAVSDIAAVLDEQRAIGTIGPMVATGFAGSASKLDSVRAALLGDGTFVGTLNSSLVLALIVVYLLMCALFQSFTSPLVIMFSVPLATLGGFAGLFAVFIWSATNRYMPMQTLDVLTMLGFIILIGVVVNNAILIVHQTNNFMRGAAHSRHLGSEPLAPREAIAEAVRTRVRPIFMSTCTSIGGMLPLVLMPGAGSELYRGLGSVVVGGLLVSTVFTIILVPLLYSLVLDAQALLRGGRPAPQAESPAAVEGGAVSLGVQRASES